MTKPRFRFTKIHINALFALIVLFGMFVGTMAALMWIIQNAETLGCGAGEAILAVVAIMGADAAGVVYVVKMFAAQPANGKPDEH